jgi:ribonuclease-3
LEFLGDAVLKMAVTEYLYEKFPEKNEGDLTKIRCVAVSDEILYQIAQRIGIEDFIKVGTGEQKAQSQKLESVQACVMEALFGALYLSSDRDTLKKFITSELSELIDDIAENKTVYNAKALLQEYTQAQTKELPQYILVEETGKAHEKVFVITVSYKNEVLGKASGKTKKQAQQEAAYQACKSLGLIKE